LGRLLGIQGREEKNLHFFPKEMQKKCKKLLLEGRFPEKRGMTAAAPIYIFIAIPASLGGVAAPGKIMPAINPR